MVCDEAEILLHLLFDDEVDPAYVRGVHAHAAGCPRCAAKLGQYRSLRTAMSKAHLAFAAPLGLGLRIGAQLSAPAARAPVATPTVVGAANWSWLVPFRGFALGAAVSAAVAATVVVGIFRSDRDQVIVSDVVSAYLRSLKSDRMTDLASSDRQQVGPWFASRVEAQPPIPDLSQRGITLVGGRVDYVRGRPVATLVYKRDNHVFNLFVAPGDDAGRDDGITRLASLQGVNVELWSERGLKFCAVADTGSDELDDFQAEVHVAAGRGQS